MHDAKRRSWLRRSTLSAALVVAALASSPLLALPGSSNGNLKGKVTGWEKLVPQVYADPAKNESHRYTWREPSPTVRQDFRRLSANVSRDVCVAAFASGTTQAHDPVAIKVTGGRMTPATIVLSPGSRLSFKNADPFEHVLYEARGGGGATAANAGPWAANPTAPGSSREWAATALGVHEIRDELFPSIVMYVVVDPSAADFAFADREGTFSMALAQGDYTLRAFFEGKPVGKELAGVHIGPGALDLREPLLLSGAGGTDAR
ncbi:MAG: hypothetical protein M3O36_01705 [Myxococcota bacterium]|nr:hypothetical protein [Myxococcota bacterium]